MTAELSSLVCFETSVKYSSLLFADPVSEKEEMKEKPFYRFEN